MRVSPFSQPDDGLLETIFFASPSRVTTLKLFDKVKSDGAHIYHEGINCYRSRKVRISLKENSILQVDGEIYYCRGDVEVECLHQAVQVLY
jgi:diacylglycerol kinase family enzyme